MLHGAFAVTNFLKSRLNDYEKSRSVSGLARLVVAETYVRNLIERAPGESDRLMVSLVALGLRLEALLFCVGELLGAADEGRNFSMSSFDVAFRELDQAIETVDIIVTGELPLMTEEELDEIPEVEISTLLNEETK